MKGYLKIRLVLTGLTCIAVVFGVSLHKYNNLNLTEDNYLLLENIEALAQDENTGGHRYPDLAGKPEFCTLYIYKKGGINYSVL